MKIVTWEDLTSQEKKLLAEAKKVAERSRHKRGHRIGCILLTDKEKKFYGATNDWVRSTGSTCAERMAMDQYYFHRLDPEVGVPRLMVIIGTFNHRDWSDDFICTPCGVCLEMMLKMKRDLALKRLNLLCSSWNQTRIVRTRLANLYPYPRPR